MPDEAFTVTVTCEEGVWTAAVQGVPEVSTRTRHLSGVDTQVREQLADLLDRPAGSFLLEYHLHEERSGSRLPGR
jgi:hypothetical protein